LKTFLPVWGLLRRKERRSQRHAFLMTFDEVLSVSLSDTETINLIAEKYAAMDNSLSFQ